MILIKLIVLIIASTLAGTALIGGMLWLAGKLLGGNPKETSK